MKTWAYTALDAGGLERSGRLEAAGERQAAEALRGQALFVLSIREDEPARPAGPGTAEEATRRSGGLASLRPVTSGDRMFFYRQLALMVRAGLTLLSALRTCEEGVVKPRFAAALERVRRRVQAGSSFSQALEAEPRYFLPIEIRLLESAELSGDLDVVLERLARYLERAAELRSKLLTGFMYPAIVVLTSIAVAAFLVIKVIPKFAAFFARRQMALPWATQALLDVSAFVGAHGLALAAGAGAVAAAVAIVHRTPRGRLAIDRALLAVPGIGPLLTSSSVANLARTLSMLLSSGVTLLASLRVTAATISNRFLSDRVERSTETVLAGRELAESLRHPALPGLVVQIVTVGERTGSLPEVLEELADYFDRDLEARIRRLTTLIEPAMILVVGSMVGFVYFAFFQAILQLTAR